VRVSVEPGVEVHVQDLGSGPVVVLVAGFGLDRRVWDAQVRSLTATHRVVSVDQRGHGLSDAPLHGYDVPRLAEDLLAVLDHLRIKRCSLVGWSFGGQVVFQAALRRPEAVDGVILVGSSAVRASRSDAFPYGPPAEAMLKSLVDAEKQDRLAARRSTIAAGFAAPPEAAVLDFLVDCFLAMPSWAAIACYESMLRTDLVDRLPSVSMPVHQIMGTADPVQSMEGARWLRDHLPTGRLVELEGVGHYPMFEAPDRFDISLRGLLGDSPDPVGGPPVGPACDGGART
jgi:non-heme chloroperoxidase